MGISETPWPAILVLLIAGALLAAVWNARRKTWALIAAAACLAGCVVVYFVERSIVTESERVEANIHAMVDACVRNDVDTVLSFIAPQELKLQTMLRGGLLMVDIDDDARISDVEVKTRLKETQADSHFRVNATIHVKLFQHEGRHPSRWLLNWQKIEGEWKVVGVHRLHPIDGRELHLLDHAE